MILQGQMVELRPLSVADVSDAYVGWMNDPELNRFMETRWRAHSRADVEAFVAEKAASGVEHLFGVFARAAGAHLGNLKIGPVNPHHQTADLSYFIGAVEARGRGAASEAVTLAVAWAFDGLGLQKLNAGVYAANLASARVLEKAGFVREGVRRGQVAFEGGRADVIEYGLLRSERR